jgi:hypothetical protein
MGSVFTDVQDVQDVQGLGIQPRKVVIQFVSLVRWTKRATNWIYGWDIYALLC